MVGTLYEHLNYNFVRDIAPVASISREPNLMVVHPLVPVTTVPEFIAYATANPGKVTMASSGNGTIVHVSGEMFKMMTGVSMLHVPTSSLLFISSGPTTGLCLDQDLIA